ncbi:hypothetical protein [Rhizobium phage RHph_X3_2]|nr:hypothetical protein [Rhizobium phage RHph_X3_2]
MTKLQVTRANIYGKGGKVVAVGTTIDSKKVVAGAAALKTKVMDTSLVVATPEAATEAETVKEPESSTPAGEQVKEPQVEKLDREQLEASAKTLGVKFTKSTTDEELLAAINEKLGE